MERALRAGKHVYSAVPMAVSEEEIARIIDAVRETGLVYMMGETSYYNPATVYARKQHAAGSFGRIFYTEGDYVHDMDLGFYDAYQYSGGDRWKETASYPPMLYPTHAIGGVLGAVPAHAVSVSCVGVKDDRNDGVFDKDVSMFGNDFSNATALFELNDGGVMRTNEMRRVGYPSHIRESRFRFFGTEASFEQLAKVTVWQDKENVHDISEQMETRPSMSLDDPSLANVAPELRDAFVSGLCAGPRRRPAAGGVPRRTERPRGQPPLPGGRLRHGGQHRHAAAGQRLGGRPVHAARHRGARVRPPRRRAAAHPRLRRRPGGSVASMYTMTTPAVQAPRGPVTRKDVARYAGVSTAVVSYVVNGGPKKVAPATEAKVQDAIRRPGLPPQRCGAGPEAGVQRDASG